MIIAVLVTFFNQSGKRNVESYVSRSVRDMVTTVSKVSLILFDYNPKVVLRAQTRSYCAQGVQARVLRATSTGVPRVYKIGFHRPREPPSFFG